MTEVEIGLIAGVASLIVERISSHFVARNKAEQWVRKTFAGLVQEFIERVDKAEAAHAECKEELARMSAILADITTEPAE